MHARRGARPSQVRPRPPSHGRPAAVRVRAVSPSPTRLGVHRRIERGPGLPLAAKGLLALAIVALVVAVAWLGSGGIGPLASAAARAVGGVVSGFGSLVAKQSPAASTALSHGDVPAIKVPANPYTNADTVDVTVEVPPDVEGQTDHVVRLWVASATGEPAVVDEVALGRDAVLVVPAVPLAEGRNDIQASIRGPGGETDRSAAVAWFRDQSPPPIRVTSPAKDATVNGDTVLIRGSTQAASRVVARSGASAGSDAGATVEADAQGVFELRLPLVPGANTVVLSATDPAGNSAETSLTLQLGTGKLSAALAASVSQFSASKLPREASFTVVVTNPDGAPLAGATALFTVQVPGLQAIVSSEVATDAAGRASFSIRIPKGAMPGGGLASVLVRADALGTVTDRVVLTVR